METLLLRGQTTGGKKYKLWSGKTHSSQSTATSRLISWVGRPTAVRIRSMVTSPALGILAAPTLARVAVRLDGNRATQPPVTALHLREFPLLPFIHRKALLNSCRRTRLISAVLVRRAAVEGHTGRRKWSAVKCESRWVERYSAQCQAEGRPCVALLMGGRRGAFAELHALGVVFAFPAAAGTCCWFLLVVY